MLAHAESWLSGEEGVVFVSLTRDDHATLGVARHQAIVVYQKRGAGVVKVTFDEFQLPGVEPDADVLASRQRDDYADGRAGCSTSGSRSKGRRLADMGRSPPPRPSVRGRRRVRWWAPLRTCLLSRRKGSRSMRDPMSSLWHRALRDAVRQTPV